MSFWDFKIKCNLAIVGLYLIPWSLSIATPYAQEKNASNCISFDMVAQESEPKFMHDTSGARGAGAAATTC